MTFSPRTLSARIARFFNESVARAPIDAHEKARLQQFTVFVVIGVAVMFCYGAYNLAVGDLLLTSLIFLAATALVFGWLLLCNLPLGQLVYRSNGVLFGSLVLYMFVTGGDDGSKGLWLFAFPLIAFFLMGKREGLLWSVGMLAMALALLSLLPLAGLGSHAYGHAFLARFITVYGFITAITYWFEHFRDHYRHSRDRELQRLSEVLTHSGDILYRCNLHDGSYDYISDAFTRILGYSREEADQLAFSGATELIHPDYREVHGQLVEKVLAGNSVGRNGFVAEYPMRHINGSYLWFANRMVLVSDGFGRPEYIIGSSRQITAEKNAEQAVQEAHGQMLTILDSIDAHVYAVDPGSYRILYMNGKMKKDFGDKEGEVCWLAFRCAQAPCAHCTIPRLAAEGAGAAKVVEWEGYNPLTRRWYRNFDRMVGWVDNTSVKLQIAFDITRIKELEVECGHLQARFDALPNKKPLIAAREESPPAPQGKRLETILLVEDDRMVREVGEIMLASLDFQVLSAKNGAEAVGLLQQHLGEIVLVLCDQHMPDMDGWQTIAALRQKKPALPVIMISGNDLDPGEKAGTAMAPQAFLRKPYSRETMRRAIAEAFGKG